MGGRKSGKSKSTGVPTKSLVQNGVVPQPQFGLGYRFNPTEQELILFLKNRILGRLLPGTDEILIERDLYGAGEKMTPWKLFKEDDPWQTVVEMTKILHPEKLIYVFTRLSKVGIARTKQKSRVAGCGHWHGNSAPDPVRDNDGFGKKIGSKRSFTFRSEEETVGQWTMYEYTIDGPANGISGIDCEDYVLCRIKRDDSRRSKGGKLVRKRKSSYSDDPVVEWRDQSSSADEEEGLNAVVHWGNKKLRSNLAQNSSYDNASAGCSYDDSNDEKGIIPVYGLEEEQISPDFVTSASASGDQICCFPMKEEEQNVGMDHEQQQQQEGCSGFGNLCLAMIGAAAANLATADGVENSVTETDAYVPSFDDADQIYSNPILKMDSFSTGQGNLNAQLMDGDRLLNILNWD